MDQAEPPRYIPLKPLSEINVQDIIDAVQTGNQEQIHRAKKMLSNVNDVITDTKTSLRELIHR